MPSPTKDLWGDTDSLTGELCEWCDAELWESDWDFYLKMYICPECGEET